METNPRAQLQEELRAMAELMAQVAADLAGFAALPAQRGHLEPSVASGELDQPLRTALQDLRVAHHELARLHTRLSALRRPYVARQLQALGVDANARELRLNLTGRALPGWLTVGFHPAELVMDLRWGLPFGDGAARYVYFALALEHFYFPVEARLLVTELRRVLASGGVLRVVVPDLEKYVRAYARGDRGFFAGHADHWPWARAMRTNMEVLMAMSGAGQGRWPGDFFGHKFGYDYETLALLLSEAGFTRIVRSEYMASDDPELRVDSISWDAKLAIGGENLNLFVEAS